MADKKLVLRVVIKLMSLAVVGFFLYVLLTGLFNDENKQLAGAVIDVSQIQPGEYQVFDNGSRKILLLRRTEQQLVTIKDLSDELYDVDSSRDLPSGLSTLYRSIKPELFVAYAYDPFFGCGIEVDNKAEQINSICSAVKYDFSGRIYKGSASQSNLIIPEYHYIDDNTVVINP